MNAFFIIKRGNSGGYTSWTIVGSQPYSTEDSARKEAAQMARVSQCTHLVVHALAGYQRIIEPIQVEEIDKL